MKKIILLTCIVLTALVTMAQTKKVAILKVVDRTGRLSLEHKFMLRSNMESAVNKTVGYEAYDRASLDMILSELSFQHSGLVNEAEIRELERMTGVSLILVTEASLTGDNKIFVSAKILNVETRRIEIVENYSMGQSSDAIQEGCSILAKRMFGTPIGSTAVEKYNITRKSSNEYIFTGQIMDKYEYREFLGKNCPSAYRYYEQGKILSTTGWCFFGVCPALIAAGSAMICEYTPGVPETGVAFLIVGCVGLTCVSIPLLAVGYTKQHKSVKIYNQRCSRVPTSILSVNLTAGQNGLGLAMQF